MQLRHTLPYLMTVAVLAATTAFAGTVTGTNTVTNSAASAKVKIRKAITLTNTADLDFGGVVVTGVAASTVTVTAAGVLTTAVGGDILAFFNTPAAAGFTVGGTPNATYAINAIPGVSMNGPAPATPIPVAFTLSKVGGTLSAGGSDTFTVGGTASIPATVTAGDYTNVFSVTVLYN